MIIAYLIMLLLVLLLLVSYRVSLSTALYVNLNEGALGSNAALIACFVNLCI